MAEAVVAGGAEVLGGTVAGDGDEAAVGAGLDVAAGLLAGGGVEDGCVQAPKNKVVTTRMLINKMIPFFTITPPKFILFRGRSTRTNT